MENVENIENVENTVDIKSLKLGGWQFEKLEACNLPQRVATGFGEALGRLTGAEYVPLLYVAHQQVSGTNHMLICKVSPVVEHPEAKIAAVYLHETLPSTDRGQIVGDFRLVSVKPIEVNMF